MTPSEDQLIDTPDDLKIAYITLQNKFREMYKSLSDENQLLKKYNSGLALQLDEVRSQVLNSYISIMDNLGYTLEDIENAWILHDYEVYGYIEE